MPEPDQPKPDDSVAAWCVLYAPTLPARVESVIAEWRLDPSDAAHVRDILLNHVRQSVITT
jgi:hypothetical protein